MGKHTVIVTRNNINNLLLFAVDKPLTERIEMILVPKDPISLHSMSKDIPFTTKTTQALKDIVRAYFDTNNDVDYIRLESRELEKINLQETMKHDGVDGCKRCLSQ